MGKVVGQDFSPAPAGATVATDATGGKAAEPPKEPTKTILPPGPEPPGQTMSVKEEDLPEGTHEARTTTKPRTQSLTDEEMLRANMERAKRPVPPGHDAHHLVPKKGGGTWGAIARQTLRRVGLNINDADNGSALPGSNTPRGTVDEPEGGPYHGTAHTDAYYKEIARRVRQAKTEAAAREALRKIQEDIKNGDFPH